MNNRQSRAHVTIRGSIGWLRSKEHAKYMARIPQLAPLRADLEAVLRDIERNLVEQDLASMELRGGGALVKQLRTDLRKKHMIRIAQHGRLILRGLPGINESLRVPHARRPDKEQITAARRIAKAVRPHANAFYAKGYKKDFVTALLAAAKALEVAVGGTDETAMSKRSRATRDLRDQVRQGREIVRLLDQILQIELLNDPAALRDWTSMKRVRKRAGRPPNRRGKRGGEGEADA